MPTSTKIDDALRAAIRSDQCRRAAAHQRQRDGRKTVAGRVAAAPADASKNRRSTADTRRSSGNYGDCRTNAALRCRRDGTARRLPITLERQPPRQETTRDQLGAKSDTRNAVCRSQNSRRSAAVTPLNLCLALDAEEGVRESHRDGRTDGSPHCSHRPKARRRAVQPAQRQFTCQRYHPPRRKQKRLSRLHRVRAMIGHMEG